MTITCARIFVLKVMRHATLRVFCVTHRLASLFWEQNPLRERSKGAVSSTQSPRWGSVCVTYLIPNDIATTATNRLRTIKSITPSNGVLFTIAILCMFTENLIQNCFYLIFSHGLPVFTKLIRASSNSSNCSVSISFLRQSMRLPNSSVLSMA